MTALTRSQENYIKAIYELSLHGKGVRITDVAAYFNVTKPSVVVAVKALQKKALIRRDDSRLVYLTDEGRIQAKRLSDTFLLIKEFLTNVLHVYPQIAQIDAYAMEHLLSAETTCALCRYFKRKTCSNECAVLQSIEPRR